MLQSKFKWVELQKMGSELSKIAFCLKILSGNPYYAKTLKWNSEITTSLFWNVAEEFPNTLLSPPKKRRKKEWVDKSKSMFPHTN